MQLVVSSHDRASRNGQLPRSPLPRRYSPADRDLVRHARPPGGHLGWSGSEAALALSVGPQRAQEVHAPEVGPEGLAEVELAVRALPEQETAEPLLSRRADHQVPVSYTHLTLPTIYSV